MYLKKDARSRLERSYKVERFVSKNCSILPSKSTFRRYFKSSVPLVGFIASHSPGFPSQSSLCISLNVDRGIFSTFVIQESYIYMYMRNLFENKFVRIELPKCIGERHHRVGHELELILERCVLFRQTLFRTAEFRVIFVVRSYGCVRVSTLKVMFPEF